MIPRELPAFLNLFWTLSTSQSKDIKTKKSYREEKYLEDT